VGKLLEYEYSTTKHFGEHAMDVGGWREAVFVMMQKKVFGWKLLYSFAYIQW
jgi:hypothetical protein